MFQISNVCSGAAYRMRVFWYSMSNSFYHCLEFFRPTVDDSTAYFFNKNDFSFRPQIDVVSMRLSIWASL